LEIFIEEKAVWNKFKTASFSAAYCPPPGVEATLVRTFPNESVFNLAAKYDTPVLVLAVGEISYNPILITNF